MLIKQRLKNILKRFFNLHRRLKHTCRISLTNRRQLTKLKKAIRLNLRADDINDSTTSGETICYFYVDHTCHYRQNSGIQQVVRSSLIALAMKDIAIIPVKWNPTKRCFQKLDVAEMACLLLFCSQKINRLHWLQREATGKSITQTEKNQLLFIPEVPHINNHKKNLTKSILEAARELELKIAFVFYDTTPLEQPELNHMRAEHKRYINTLLQADYIFPISNFSKEKLNQFTTPGSKRNPNLLIRTIHLASSLKETTKPEKVRINPKKPYILSVGTISKHKNQITLIEAFKQFKTNYPNHPLQLRLIGFVCPTLQPTIYELTKKNRDILITEGVDNKKLVLAYQNCLFTVFPSYMEGFGLPIIESLYFNKPCITANFGAMAEVAGDSGCLLVNTREKSCLADAIELLVTDKQLLEHKTQEATQRRIATWDDYATELLNVLTEITPPEVQFSSTTILQTQKWITHEI